MDINHVDDLYKRTALALAARTGKIDLVRLLLAVDGIDVNLAAYNLGHPTGSSPIGEAVRNSHYDIVAVLLEDDRVDVNRFRPATESFGWRPRTYPRGFTGPGGRPEWECETRTIATSILNDAVTACKETYRSTGLNPDAYRMFKLLVSCQRVDISQRYFKEYGTPGSSPFVKAIENGWLDVVDLFLKQPRFDLSEQYHEDFHPLIVAGRSSPEV